MQNWNPPGMSAPEIRKTFLDFFEKRGHKIVPSREHYSFSLKPVNDPSLLLINSGMAPLKPYFEGREKPPAPRMASCQRCIRTVDIEKVGKTNRHLTFFEMLGNFSIGGSEDSYFKEDAIKYAWDLLTGDEEGKFGVPKERLTITVHEKDEESPKLWESIAGIAEEKIIRLGDEHNLWTAGETGPCGYDTEIFYDLLFEELEASNLSDVEKREAHLDVNYKTYQLNREGEECGPTCECGRFLEVWNLVFIEFTRSADGTLTPLPHKHVDTGMGLERIACVLQGKKSVFDTDLLWNVTAQEDALRYMAGVRPGDVAKDHLRAALFLIMDGVDPSNVGAHYVTRRLTRRGLAYHPSMIGGAKYDLLMLLLYYTMPPTKDLSTTKTSEITNLEELHPGTSWSLSVNPALKKLQAEADLFFQIRDKHLDSLYAEIRTANRENRSVSGEFLFRLHDTYGFLLEWVLPTIEVDNISWDREEFERLINQQRERARAVSPIQRTVSHSTNAFLVAATEFIGYDTLQTEAKITHVTQRDDGIGIYTDKSPFYSTGGGQPADTGTIKGKDFIARVEDVPAVELHLCTLEKGRFEDIKIGETVELTVDADRRRAIMRAHSATHLLNKALRLVLGSGVSQQGSALFEDRFRFDFSNPKALTDEEITKVEELVNGWILDSLNRKTEIKSLDEVDEMKKSGEIIALFDEKYSDQVKVVSFGDVSIELCGGTHCSNTSEIGSFVIEKEESVASGIRRITALTGKEAYAASREYRRLGKDLERRFNVPTEEVTEKIESVIEESHDLHEININLRRELSSQNLLDNLISRVKSVGDLRLLITEITDIEKGDLKFFADRILEKLKEGAVLLTLVGEDGIRFTAKASKAAIEKGVTAKELVQRIAKATGGSGGGKPELAEGGGKDPSKIENALRELTDWAETALR